MNLFQSPQILALIERAIDEDLCLGDVTTELLIPETLCGEGTIIAKEQGILAGQRLAESIFARIDPIVSYETLKPDTSSVGSRDIIARISGPIRSILAGERTVLNFLQHLSGIATFTHRIVNQIEDTPCRIVDTRKTTPGLRLLEKYAVRVGGGYNHRINLGDGILIKDNHIRACGSISRAVSTARQFRRHPLLVQIEVTCYQEALEAVQAGADALLLDNMSLEQMEPIIRAFRSTILLEASGNITAQSVLRYAQSGVHLISMGALTHSAGILDLSLNLE